MTAPLPTSHYLDRLTRREPPPRVVVLEPRHTGLGVIARRIGDMHATGQSRRGAGEERGMAPKHLQIPGRRVRYGRNNGAFA